MSIDWLDAEKAIDRDAVLEARRAELEARVQKEPVALEDVLELLDVLDEMGAEVPNMARIAQWGVKRWMNDAGLRAWLGTMWLRGGKVEQAVKELNAAIMLEKHQALARLTRGQVYLRTEKFDKALLDFEAGLLGKPNDRIRDELDRMVIVALARVGRAADALEKQRAFAARKPDDVRILVDGADLLELLGRVDEAKAELDRLVAARPWDTDLLFQCAMRALERDELARAKTLADDLLKRDSQHLEGWNLRAQIHYRLGMFEQALTDHSMIDELSKSMPPDYAFRAKCHVDLGNKADAIACLEIGLKDKRLQPDQRTSVQRTLDTLHRGK
ncbi:MAG: tetratricopeptide repeat protein [Planctomycetes bacterium]|nr:tetratricopeptide repeat protein [Planctomycetota bacterium]NUQ34149.1 tetratricopeptide repeat protein [Planctomycetaceae bacterium]